MHIYTARSQRATKYRVPLGMRSYWSKNPPNRLCWARCCDKRRPAKNLVVQVFYDDIRFFCIPGKGCKKEMGA